PPPAEAPRTWRDRHRCYPRRRTGPQPRRPVSRHRAGPPRSGDPRDRRRTNTSRAAPGPARPRWLRASPDTLRRRPCAAPPRFLRRTAGAPFDTRGGWRRSSRRLSSNIEALAAQPIVQRFFGATSNALVTAALALGAVAGCKHEEQPPAQYPTYPAPPYPAQAAYPGAPPNPGQPAAPAPSP